MSGSIDYGDTIDAQFLAAWNNSKLVIIATLSEGPDAGKGVACITPRAFFRKNSPRAAREARKESFMASLRGAIRKQVMAGVSDLSPETDKDFMDDLAILMAVKLASGEPALEGTGLFSLLLAVNPDETAPWTARGFIRGQDAYMSLPEAESTIEGDVKDDGP